MNFESKFSKIPNGVKFALGLLLPSSLTTLLISLIMKDWGMIYNQDSGKVEFGIFCYCLMIDHERVCENYYDVTGKFHLLNRYLIYCLINFQVSFLKNLNEFFFFYVGLLRFLQIMLVLGVILILSAEVIGLCFAFSEKSRYPLAVSSLLASLVVCLCWVLFFVKKNDIIPMIVKSPKRNIPVGSSFALSIVSFGLLLLASLVTLKSKSIPINSTINNPNNWNIQPSNTGINCLQPNLTFQDGIIPSRLPTYEECVFPSDLPPAYEEKA